MKKYEARLRVLESRDKDLFLLCNLVGVDNFKLIIKKTLHGLFNKEELSEARQIYNCCLASGAVQTQPQINNKGESYYQFRLSLCSKEDMPLVDIIKSLGGIMSIGDFIKQTVRIMLGPGIIMPLILDGFEGYKFDETPQVHINMPGYTIKKQSISKQSNRKETSKSTKKNTEKETSKPEHFEERKKELKEKINEKSDIEIKEEINQVDTEIQDEPKNNKNLEEDIMSLLSGLDF